MAKDDKPSQALSDAQLEALIADTIGASGATPPDVLPKSLAVLIRKQIGGKASVDEHVERAQRIFAARRGQRRQP